jgi:hypothetical protein
MGDLAFHAVDEEALSVVAVLIRACDRESLGAEWGRACSKAP